MNKSVIITGCQGTLGKSLLEYYKKDNIKVTGLTHLELDLTDSKAVQKFFKNNPYDIIIHCAGKLGWRTLTPTVQDFADNILMQENITKFAQFKKLFIMGSGAEDAETPNYYGLSKLINRKLARPDRRITNLKLYNVFSPNESNERFIKSSLIKYINKQPIEIWENKKFDFFYIEDFYKLIKLCSIYTLYNEIDCSYDFSLYLSEVAAYINLLDEYQVPVIIKKESNNHYIGKENVVCNLKYKGIFEGISEMYEILKKK